MRRSLLVTGLLLALAGCATAPDVRAQSAHGVVMAPDVATAAETARIWDDVAPRLAELRVGLESRGVEIWLYDRLADDDVYGGYDARRGRILLDAARRHPDVTLAHELVHAYEPASWSRLPAVVREGLADWLASRAVPAKADEMRASRAISLASYAVGGLPVPVVEDGHVRMVRMGVPLETELTPVEALRIPHGRIRGVGEGPTLKALYGMGLLIVSRAGVEQLVALSVQAEREGLDVVPPERILAAARLDPDPVTWLPAIEALVAEPAQQAAVRRILGLEGSPPGDPDARPPTVRD